MARKFKGLDKAMYSRSAMQWMGIGIEFAIVCGVTAWLGSLMDKVEPRTSPGWMILGFFVGFGIMVRSLLKRARRFNEEMEKEESEKISEENNLDK